MSPKSIGSGSKFGGSSVCSNKRRWPDRRLETSLSVGSTCIDEYVNGLVAHPEEDEELAMEIARRQNSAVRAKVTKFDQLDAQSRCAPPLVEVRRAEKSRGGDISERVQSFEVIELESRVRYGPSVEEMRRRRESQGPRRFPDSGAPAELVYSL